MKIMSRKNSGWNTNKVSHEDNEQEDDDEDEDEGQHAADDPSGLGRHCAHLNL